MNGVGQAISSIIAHYSGSNGVLLVVVVGIWQYSTAVHVTKLLNSLFLLLFGVSSKQRCEKVFV